MSEKPDVQNYQKSCWMLKFSGSKNHKLVGHIIGIFCVGLDTDQQVYVFLSVLGRKYQFSVWAAKYFSQGLSYRQGFRDRGHPISFFYHLSSLSSRAYQVERLCSRVYTNEKMRLLCWILIFLHFGAQLLSGSDLSPVSVFTIILDSLENIRLRKESPPRRMVSLEHSHFQVCCIQKLQKPIPVVWGIQNSNFAQIWATRTGRGNNYTMFAVQEGHTNVRNGQWPMAICVPSKWKRPLILWSWITSSIKYKSAHRLAQCLAKWQIKCREIQYCAEFESMSRSTQLHTLTRPNH